jgi:hypothetical protein
MTQTNAQAVAKKGLEVTTFHKDVFATIDTARKATNKAGDTMRSKLANLLRSKYGATMPTYEQFRADRAALKELATQKGLADDQWVRKPYNAAVHLLYGALPEAQTAAAIAKRKLREAEAANKPSGATGVSKGTAKPEAGKAGAQKGETAPRNPSADETIEQYIARVGLWKVMDACARLLNADKSSTLDAKAMQAIVKKYAKAA